MGAGSTQGAEVVIHLQECFAHALAAEGVPMSKAKADGARLGADLARDFGGQMIYMPMNASARSRQLHRRILCLFDGKNHHQVARDTGVCLQTVYKVVKAASMADELTKSHDAPASPVTSKKESK